MNMKKYFYALMACTILTVSFTSCSDDDDDPFAPTEVVTNLSFTDADMEPYKIGGTVTWSLPSSEDNITGYVIYLNETATGKDHKLGEVTKGKTSFDIPNGTEFKAHLSVVAQNIMGEASNSATIEVKDNSGDPVVTELAFTDTDPSIKTIAGTLTWKLPVPEAYVTGYVIYVGDKNDEKGTKVGEVAAGISTFDVPEGTPYKAFLQVVAKRTSGESEIFAAMPVTNYVVPSKGLYILNGGNQGENNASISYYDIATGKLTTDIYKTANGSGLGDSAEQMLIYGSKMYVTVTASNRIAVLDMNGKLIESIEPKEGDEPMNPRCMVADNGKIYVSYFYGHAVAVLDTTTLKIENKVSVGRYPEQLAVANGKIYVSNSGGLDYPNYGSTVSVIDLNTFKVEKDIDVIINPGSLMADSQGDIYVISLGDYGDIKNTLQRIDGKTGAVTVMDNATKMTIVNDKLYTAYAQWGVPTITYKKYDVLTEQLIDGNIIKDGTDIASPYAIAVDPLSEDFYITESSWGSTGSLFTFTAEGKLKDKAIDTGGYEAKSVIFRQ